MHSLTKLNKEQKEAVTSVDGPVMILAGAGSGKTRVITERISYLIKRKQISPKQILAVTFTNKAAEEMRARIKEMLAVKKLEVHVSTFHSLGVSLLRKSIHLLGYKSNFIIYDSKDQYAVIKSIIEDQEFVDFNLTDVKLLHYEISQAKSSGKQPVDILMGKFVSQQNLVKKIFFKYQEIMKGCNAIDFEDILILALKLFKKNPKFMESLTRQFRYIMVDEYQDTNFTQYQFLKNLTKFHNNICVVGDDDQSIYGWRGAEIKNIFDFEKDYPEVKFVSLEQNYRSTKKILAAANQVIASNTQRMPKKLWSQKNDGKNLNWYQAENEVEEMDTVARQIRKEVIQHGRKFFEYAILYRSNYQSRLVEETLRDKKIPYKIVGGTSYFDREEIRDVIAYLKLIYNTNDELSLQRIINVPRRGIGKISLMNAISYSKKMNIPLFKVMSNAREYLSISKDYALTMEVFTGIIENYRQRFSIESFNTVLKELIDEIGYIRYLETKRIDIKARERRLTNVNELLLSVKNYCEQNSEANLQKYLERVSFLSEGDSNSDNNANKISIMTLHSAKGLEFSYVFIVGMSEGIFPNQRSVEEMGEDEERRLCYVGITRAKQELTFTMAKFRNRYGEKVKQYPSSFLLSIDPKLFSVPIIGEPTKEVKEEKSRESRATFFSQFKQMEGSNNG